MTERELGKSGFRVSSIGLGCMGMSEFYDPKRMDDAESVRVIHRYLDSGGNFSTPPTCAASPDGIADEYHLREPSNAGGRGLAPGVRGCHRHQDVTEEDRRDRPHDFPSRAFS